MKWCKMKKFQYLQTGEKEEEIALTPVSVLLEII